MKSNSIVRYSIKPVLYGSYVNILLSSVHCYEQGKLDLIKYLPWNPWNILNHHKCVNYCLIQKQPQSHQKSSQNLTHLQTKILRGEGLSIDFFDEVFGSFDVCVFPMPIFSLLSKPLLTWQFCENRICCHKFYFTITICFTIWTEL